MAETEAVFFDIGDTLVEAPKKWVPEAKELLEQIGSTNVRLGLISNTSDLSRPASLAQHRLEGDLRL